MKTMEAALMLEADTAAKLDKQTYNAQRFLLLLGNAVRHIQYSLNLLCPKGLAQ